MIKNTKEIEIMREGGRLLSEILRDLSAAVKPGITTGYLDKLSSKLVTDRKVKPAFLNYEGFPANICISINDEVVHGVPSDKRIIKEGDVLKLDMGIIYKNYYSDSAITVLVPGDKKNSGVKNKLIEVTKESLYRGISKARAGNTLGDIGHTIQDYVESSGFEVVRELVGHGIGKELHEPPQVFNYGVPGKGLKLQVGMVLAIEPMVVTGTWKIKEGSDGFVFKTKDGGLAAHFEHTVAITDSDPIILTKE
jgi:methionyl aminopeptidase